MKLIFHSPIKLAAMMYHIIDQGIDQVQVVIIPTIRVAVKCFCAGVMSKFVIQCYENVHSCSNSISEKMEKCLLLTLNYQVLVGGNEFYEYPAK